MKTRRTAFFLVVFLAAMMTLLWGNNFQNSIVSADGFTTIGTGTPESCQSNAAVNALSNAVAAGGVIEFDCGPNPVTINVNTNITNQNVTVNGGGLINLSGEDLRQIFYVMNGGLLTLNDLILSDGAANTGGALYVEPLATAVLNRSFITSSQSTFDGGGIYNWGTLTLNYTTLGSNIAGSNGGGILNNGGNVTINDSYLISNQAQSGGAVYTANGQFTMNRSAVRSSVTTNMGGGIYLASQLSQITNSTFSNNKALQGGALSLHLDANILNSTFFENKADIGGAIWNQSSANTTLKNSIVAGSLNSNGNNPSLNCDGPSLTSMGRNIIGDGTCLDNPGSSGDKFNTAPDLGIWFGAPIRGYIPNTNSPAVDYGLGCPNVDQRGYPRPLGGACDVGSMELGWLVFLPAVIH